jgi:hypothetical protein
MAEVEAAKSRGPGDKLVSVNRIAGSPECYNGKLKWTSAAVRVTDRMPFPIAALQGVFVT